MKKIYPILLTGFVFCSVLSTLILVTSFPERDPIYLISNPSLGEEVWYMSIVSFFLILKLFWKTKYNLIWEFLLSFDKLLKIHGYLNDRDIFKWIWKLVFFSSIVLSIIIVFLIYGEFYSSDNIYDLNYNYGYDGKSTIVFLIFMDFLLFKSYFLELKNES